MYKEHEWKLNSELVLQHKLEEVMCEQLDDGALIIGNEDGAALMKRRYKAQGSRTNNLYHAQSDQTERELEALKEMVGGIRDRQA